MPKAKKQVRVRDDMWQEGKRCVTAHPLTGQHMAWVPGQLYDIDDPMVVHNRWAFDFGDEDRGDSGQVEQATAAPGEKRSYRRKAEPEPEVSNGPIRSGDR